MTGQTMEPDEDMDNGRFERENVTGGDASDPLDLSTNSSKADSMGSSRPIPDVRPRQELFLPAPRQHLEIPHTTTVATSNYALSRGHTDIPNTLISRPWPFSPGSPSSIARPIPPIPLGDHSPPKDLPRFPHPSSNRTYQPERNGAPMFPNSTMDSGVEDHRDMNEVEVVSNGVENLGPLSGRPLPAAYPDGALMYSPLGPSGMLSLGLSTPYDSTHMSPLSMTAASMLGRKRRIDVPKKEKEGTTSKSSPSSATVTSAQASSNSPDPNEESEPKKTKTVPDEKKDDAYWERRRKNNEAAKRSRDARRQKEEEIAVRAAWLEQENLKLRAEIAVLKNETAKLHCLLLNRRV